jgi:uncharacterized protein (TIGR02271 family)
MTQHSTPDHESFFDRIKRAFTGEPSAFDRDEEYYRARHAGGAAAGRATASQTTGAYDAVRPAYQLGHVAGAHETYAGRSFDDAEADLRRAWEAEPRNGRGAWSGVRDHARDAYARGQEQRLVLSEEQLAVGKRQVQAGEAQVRKTVETEHVRETVPLAHEEVTVERRPLSADAVDPDGISEGTIRVPLMREEAVVDKRVVPVEEVVVRTNTVTEEQTVEDTVRKERLVTEGLDATTGRPNPDRTDRRG